MTQQKKKKLTPQRRLNHLIPMHLPGEPDSRCFVSSWDVKGREADGWKVVGDKAKHLSSVRAPVEALKTKRDDVVTLPNGAGNAADIANNERNRVRAILAAADKEQGALADQLIDSGATVEAAVAAFTADREQRKAARAAAKSAAPASTPAAPAATPAATATK